MENQCNKTLKFIMNTYYVLVCISILGFFFDFTVSKRRKHKRLPEQKDEYYVPSLINFEIKGKSLAWLPVKLTGGNIETIESKLKDKNHRKCRYIEEPNCSGTNKPKRIYNAQEDKDDPDAGQGENDSEPDDDYLGNDYEAEDQSSTNEKTTKVWSDATDNVITTLLDDITAGPPLSYSTEGPLTDETEDQTTIVIPGPIVSFTSNIVPHTYSTDITIDISDTIKKGTTNKPTTQSLLVAHNKENSTHDDSMRVTSSSVLNTENASKDHSTENIEDVFITDSSNDGLSIKDSTYEYTGKESRLTMEISTNEITTEHYLTEFITETSIIEITKDSLTTKHNTDSIIQSTISDQRVFTSSVIIPFTDYPSTIYPINIPYTESVLTTVQTLQTESPIKNNKTELDRTTDKDVYDYSEDISDQKTTVAEIDTNKNHIMDSTRLSHIETPPYPRRPIDLHFPTCSGSDDSLDIRPPSFPPEDGYGGKKKEKCSTRKRKSTYHTTPVKATTPLKKNPVSNIVKKYEGYENKRKDTKVIVRIPPSLAELPVVVLKDPQTQMLSLSLISGEQDQIVQKNVYYQPPFYPQMFPPQFPYNNIYLPNYPIYNKMFPYGYGYGPNVLYNKPNYLNSLNEKHPGYINNLRWIRDTYYEDEELENSTKGKWNIFINV